MYSDGHAWTQKHDRWLLSHRYAGAAFDTSYEAVIQAVERRDRLDRAILGMAVDSKFTPVVNRLGSLRGIAPLTGWSALAVDVTDWVRFTGETTGSFLGLVPAGTPQGSPGCWVRPPIPATPMRGTC